MQSNRYDFSQVIFPKELIDQMDWIINQYESLAKSDAAVLRNMIPAEEIWRFFVETFVQENGRELKDSEFFKRLLAFKESEQSKLFSINPLELTVKEYFEKFENLSLADRKKSEFNKFLVSKNWILNDEECAEIKIGDLLVMDKAWLPFEQNERNYLQGLYSAFNEIFRERYNLALLKKLHSLALNGVTGTLYGNEREGAGDFRLIPGAFYGVNKKNATEQGCFEFLSRADACLAIELEISEDNWVIGSLRINKESLPVIKKFVEDEKLIAAGKMIYQSPRPPILNFVTTDDSKEFLQKLKDKTVFNVLDSVATEKDLESTAKALFKLICNCPEGMQIKVSSLQDHIEESEIYNEISQYMQTYYDHFEKMIVLAKQPIEKIYVIAAYIAECEHLHAFQDANCRALCMLGVMSLCKEAGLPMPMLDDANRFDMYDIKSLMQELINGMKKTLMLVENPKQANQLFKVDTNEVLKFLSSKPYLKERADYFFDVIAKEENNRLQLSQPKSWNSTI